MITLSAFEQELVLDEEESEIEPWLEKLTQAIESMGPGKAEVMTLFYVKGLPHDQIASFLDLPKGTVKRRLFDGRKDVAKVADAESVTDRQEQKRFVEAIKRLLANSDTGR